MHDWKILLSMVLVLTVCTAASAASRPGQDAQAAEARGVRTDLSANFSYSLPSRLNYDGRRGDVDTLQYRLGGQASIPGAEGWEWRLGLEYQQFSFGLPEAAPLPGTLRSVSVPFGVAWQFRPDWQIRLQVSPGLYSDFKDISGHDVFIPVLLAVSYSVNPDLRVIGGLVVEARRDIPVLPVLGARWKFAEDWTLSALFPRPGVEYAPTRDLTLFAGGELKGGAFQVHEHFGESLGRPELSNESLTYWEIRTGVGARYKLARNLSVELDLGWMVQRRFVYKEIDVTYKSHGAPYVQCGVGWAF